MTAKELPPTCPQCKSVKLVIATQVQTATVYRCIVCGHHVTRSR